MREQLDELLRIWNQYQVERTAAEHAPLAFFLDEIAPNWEHIVWRAMGALEARKRKLSPARRSMLDVLGGDPDLLSPIASIRHEPTHTQAIAWLLRRTDETAKQCCCALAKMIYGDLPHETIMQQTWRISAERTVGKFGRIDLLLESDKFVAIIELKIDAEQRPGQLTDYGAAVRNFTAGRQSSIAFLTLREDQKPTNAEAVHITLKDLLAAWLPFAQPDRAGTSGFLARYLKSIAMLQAPSLAQDGCFEEWPLAQRSRAIRFVEDGK